MAENSEVIEERERERGVFKAKICSVIVLTLFVILLFMFLPQGGGDPDQRVITNITCVYDYCTIYNGTEHSVTDTASKISGHFITGECTTFGYSTVIGRNSTPCVAQEKRFTTFEQITGIHL